MDSGLYDIVQGSDAGANQSAFADYPLYYANQFTQEDLTTNKECILARVFEADVLTHNLARGGGVGLSKDLQNHSFARTVCLLQTVVNTREMKHWMMKWQTAILVCIRL